MIQTTLPVKQAVSLIVEEYRFLTGTSAKPATLRKFAEALSEALAEVGRRVSYQSIKNWEDGAYLPDAYGMVRLAQAARRDWRGRFAVDILAAMHPETYKPASEIGHRALRSAHIVSTHLNTSNRNGGNGNGNQE